MAGFGGLSYLRQRGKGRAQFGGFELEGRGRSSNPGSEGTHRRSRYRHRPGVSEQDRLQPSLFKNRSAKGSFQKVGGAGLEKRAREAPQAPLKSSARTSQESWQGGVWSLPSHYPDPTDTKLIFSC